MAKVVVLFLFRELHLHFTGQPSEINMYTYNVWKRNVMTRVYEEINTHTGVFFQNEYN